MLFLLIFGLCWDTPLSESVREWNHLSAQFRVFDPLPLNQKEATALGWELLTDGCNKDSNSTFVGKRYILDDDRARVLIYDYHGHIAGMQMGHKADSKYLKRPRTYGSTIVNDDGHMYLTAYFMDPDGVCERLLERRQDIIGDRLAFLMGTNKYMTVPMMEKDITQTKWVQGKCFPGMGQHYWYDIKKDTLCDNMFPAFLMYDQGRLNGFGFSTDWNMKSKRVEHPQTEMLHFFFKKETQPECIAGQEYRSAQHIFFYKVTMSNPRCN